eukprot:scaffold497246_cov67-Attheya_sp.AAC.1
MTCYARLNGRTTAQLNAPIVSKSSPIEFLALPLTTVSISSCLIEEQIAERNSLVVEKWEPPHGTC